MELQRIAWIDVETTGVDPESDLLLEVACVVTTGRLHELGRESCVVRHDRDVLDAFPMDDFVREMHTGNGLLEACAQPSSMDLGEIDEWIFGLVSRTSEGHRPQLGGCSVWIDRSMVRKHLPRTYSLLHFRDFNVSTLRDFWETFVGSVDRRDREPHRALEDVLDSIRLARKIQLELARLKLAGSIEPFRVSGVGKT